MRYGLLVGMAVGLSVAGMAGVKSSSGPLLIAHCGSSFLPPVNLESPYPGNTIPAFERAIADGFDGIELDARITRDGHFVVSHDEDLGLSTDCTGFVGHTDFLDILANCKAVKKDNNPVPSPARLPSLREVFLKFLPDSRLRKIVIDIKPARMVRIVRAMQEALKGIHGRVPLEKLVFISEDDDVLAALKNLYPPAKGAIEDGLPLVAPCNYLPETCARPRATHDSISFFVGMDPPSMDLWNDPLYFWADQAQQLGYSLIAWPVNDPASFVTFRKRLPYLSMILTDLPYHRIPR